METDHARAAADIAGTERRPRIEDAGVDAAVEHRDDPFAGGPEPRLWLRGGDGSIDPRGKSRERCQPSGGRFVQLRHFKSLVRRLPPQQVVTCRRRGLVEARFLFFVWDESRDGRRDDECHQQESGNGR